MKSLWVLITIACGYVICVVAQDSSPVSIASAPGFSLQRDCVQCQLWNCYGGVNDLLECDGLNYCYCRADLSSAVNSYLSRVLSQYCTPGPATNDISAAISIYSQYCASEAGSVFTTPQTVPLSTSAEPAQPASSTIPISTSPESAPTTSSSAVTSTVVVSNIGSPVTSTTVQIETATASSNAQSSLSVPLTTLATSVSPPSVVVTLHSTLTTIPTAQATSGGLNGGNGPSLNGGEIAGIVIGIISALGTIVGVYFAWKLLKNGNKSSNSQGDDQNGGRDLRGTPGNRYIFGGTI